MSHSDISSAMPETRSVAEIMAGLPRIILAPADSVELGRRAYAHLLAGDLNLTEASIALFATRDMLTAGIVDFLAAEVAAGRLTTATAVA